MSNTNNLQADLFWVRVDLGMKRDFTLLRAKM